MKSAIRVNRCLSGLFHKLDGETHLEQLTDGLCTGNQQLQDPARRRNGDGRRKKRPQRPFNRSLEPAMSV